MAVLIIFCVQLLVFVLLGVSVTYPLLIGLVMFTAYSKFRHYTWREIFRMIGSGFKTVKSILIVLLMIGILTGLWRACGTIPYIICCASDFIRPSTIVIMSFLLNCGFSFLTGTAFGTAATMGTICMTVAVSMGINPLYVGGAVMSGLYFGDRCSPVSTSALLVSQLTGTDLHTNLRLMVKTSLVPFIVTCAIYTVLGKFSNAAGGSVDLWGLFGSELKLHWLAIVPAAVILVLSVFRVKVKWAMLFSIAASVIVCIVTQKTGFVELLKNMVFGFKAQNQEVAAMLNGGGVLSMVRVFAIITISSAYSGIFRGTGLLDGVKSGLKKISERTTPYLTVMITSLFTCMIACNQVLTVMLTHEMCSEIEPDGQSEAMDIENSAIVIAPLVPWCISNAVPLASIGAPVACTLFAFYLMLLPIYSAIISVRAKKKK